MSASDSDSWTTLINGSGYVINISEVETITNGFLVTNTYDFRLTITDFFASSSITKSISTSFTLMNWNASGKGMAFGKVSEIDGLEVALDAVFENPVSFEDDVCDRFETQITNGLAISGETIDPDTTLEHEILTNHSNCPSTESEYWYIITVFSSDKTDSSNRVQYAMPYDAIGSMYHRNYFDNTWTAWRKHINEDELVVEQGSNENGSYRKYADGMMEQWVYKTDVVWPINGQYGTLYQGTHIWEFPVAFIGDPYELGIPMALWSTGASWGAVASFTKTQVTLRAYDIVSRGSEPNMRFKAYARGKWK